MKRLLTIMVISISLNAAAQQITQDVSYLGNKNEVGKTTQRDNQTNIVWEKLVIDTNLIKHIKIGERVIAVSDIFKKDTVVVAIYVFERTDTASKLASILYEGKKNRIYKTQGYYIYKTQVATTDGKNYKQASQPVIIGALDEKRKPVKLISQ